MIDLQYNTSCCYTFPAQIPQGLKDHDGHAQQFQALVQEDIASVVLAVNPVAPKFTPGWTLPQRRGGLVGWSTFT